MTKDHYNIWAEANDRMPLAVKALAAKPGQTISNADIRLVQRGFVVGTVFDAPRISRSRPAAKIPYAWRTTDRHGRAPEPR